MTDFGIILKRACHIRNVYMNRCRKAVQNMIRFGTGGWRAIIGDEFTKKNIQILAKALSLKMKDEGVEDQGLCIGYDRRFLSKEAVKWACEVFAAEEIHVLFVDRSSPTPLVMYYVMAHDLPYGLMVTASHNPAIYNGFKVFTRGGRDADEEQTAELERYIDQVEAGFACGKSIRTVPYEEALENNNLWFMLYNYHLTSRRRFSFYYLRKVASLIKIVNEHIEKIVPKMDAPERLLSAQVLWLTLLSVSSFLTNDSLSGLSKVNKTTLCRILLDTYLAGLTVLENK